MRKRRFGDGGRVEEPSIKGWLKDRAQWAMFKGNRNKGYY